MAKDGFWFKHDNNAMSDPKCAALIADFGLEGYGLWWAILELLCQQDGYRLKKFPGLYKGLARQWNVAPEAFASMLEALLEAYELLVQDDEFIWSPTLLRRMEERHVVSEVRAEAGRLGGLKSGMTRRKSKQMLEANEANEAEERRGEKRREDKKGPPVPPKTAYAENVTLTESEYQKLVDELGLARAKRCIQLLSDYKAASGKKYKSDYHAIRVWVIQAEEERRTRVGRDGRSTLELMDEIVARCEAEEANG